MSSRPGVLLVATLLVHAAPSNAQSIVADHATTDPSSIPDSAIAAAANLRLLVRHASVGENINSGLDALQTQDARHDRSRWDFQNRGNPGWQAKVDDLVAQAALQAASFDVLTMKFCFIDPDAVFTYYRDAMLGLEASYPAKRFVWWTIPLETTGNTNRQAFNEQVRAYARANGKLLFDIADIECHNAAGVKLIDELGREHMWAEWTDEGGHLNADGSARVASALWWLMARVGGWDPGGSLSLDVTVAGSGIGAVTSAPAGISCPGVCSGDFPAATKVTLMASAVPGSRFAGWAGGGCAGTGPCTLTMSGATSVSATFLPATAAVFHAVTPCRAVDTRITPGPLGGPALEAAATRTFVLGGACGVPSDASAVSLNVTVADATDQGSLTIYPGTGPAPTTNTLRFVPGKDRANNLTMGLVGGGLSVADFQSSGTVHPIVDVNGYYR